MRRHKSPRGSELAFLKAPESEETIEICHYPSSGPVEVQEDLTHLAFEVDSLEEFGKHLASLGMEYSDGPTMKEDRRWLRVHRCSRGLRNRTDRNR